MLAVSWSEADRLSLSAGVVGELGEFALRCAFTEAE
jgi:hypothetical protein